MSVEDGETALGYLRALTGAESRPFCDGAFYEAGSSEGSLGAERLPARSRAAPLRFQPAPTMRGGARSWRERMADVEVDPAVTADMSRSAEAVKRGRGAVRVRGAVRGSSSAKGARCAVPPPCASVAFGVVVKRPRAVRKSAAAGRVAKSAGSLSSPALAVVGNAQQEAEVVAAGVISGGGSAQTAEASSSSRVAPLVHGPVRPPPKKKTRPRKKGLALLPLEGADVFRQGDWSNIEAFASTRMPMLSVAWAAALKRYESCWKQRGSFQYYAAQLGIGIFFVEVSTPAFRHRTATGCFRALRCWRTPPATRPLRSKNVPWRLGFFTSRMSMTTRLRNCRVFGSWQAYRAVKRHQGPTERKHPATPEMCDWIDAYQRAFLLRT